MAIDAADHVPMALEVATERPGPQLNALQGAGAISAVVIFADLGDKKGAKLKKYSALRSVDE